MLTILSFVLLLPLVVAHSMYSVQCIRMWDNSQRRLDNNTCDNYFYNYANKIVNCSLV